MMKRYDIVISGASYTGLALACALAQALRGGIAIAVVDRAPEGRDATGPRANSPRAFAISAGSKRMLDVLGVWPRIADAAQPVSEIEITDSSLEAGIRPALLTYENHLEDGEQASFIVPDACLASALRDAAAETTNVDLF